MTGTLCLVLLTTVLLHGSASARSVDTSHLDPRQLQKEDGDADQGLDDPWLADFDGGNTLDYVVGRRFGSQLRVKM